MRRVVLRVVAFAGLAFAFRGPARRARGGRWRPGRRGPRASGGGDEGEAPEGWPGGLTGDDELLEDVLVYGKTLAVCLAVRFLLVEPRFIPSLSMYPSLDVGDQLAVEKVTKVARPRLDGDPFPVHRGEVVVFKPPQAFRDIVNGRARDEALIKRVVAVAGDAVEVRGGVLYVNGRAQDEDGFVNERPAYDLARAVVPADCVFVLGDNRNQSLDGHIWGFLPVKNVIGRAVFKYWPPQSFGPVFTPRGKYA